MTERELTGLRERKRGQTTQDFATGISVFLLTVTFTFAFVPSTLAPFGSPATDAISAKSDRVASTVIESYGESDRSRTLRTAGVKELVDMGPDEIREEFGLRSTAQVSVTFTNTTGAVIEADLGWGTEKSLVTGDDYPNNRAAASTTRVVRMDVDGCRTGCLMVVRIW